MRAHSIVFLSSLALAHSNAAQIPGRAYHLSPIVSTGSGSGLLSIVEMGVDDSGTVMFRGTDFTGAHLFAASVQGDLTLVNPAGSGSFNGLSMTRSLPSVALVRRQPQGTSEQRLEFWPPAQVPSGVLLATAPQDFD